MNPHRPEAPTHPEPEGPGPEAALPSTWSDGEAEMIRQLLEAYDIPCRVATHLSHALFPLSVDGLGEIRLFVPAERLAEAESVLAEHRRKGLELIHGGDAAPDHELRRDEEDRGS